MALKWPHTYTTHNGTCWPMYVHIHVHIISFAVSVVRLLRIEQGGAYADVLSGDGEQSWEKEMDYLSRTLGFRTLPLDSRGQRQVWSSVHLTTLSIHICIHIHIYIYQHMCTCYMSGYVNMCVCVHAFINPTYKLIDWWCFFVWLLAVRDVVFLLYRVMPCVLWDGEVLSIVVSCFSCIHCPKHSEIRRTTV